MKITTLLLFLACLTASAGGLAQKVTLSQKNVKLEKVLSEIKKQTGYVFFYDALVLQGAGPVSIYLKDASVEIALKKTLQGLPLDFSIEQKTITIFQKPTIAKPIMADRPFVLLNIINGTVKNEKGEPLLGASVIEKGTNNATTTRLDGSFNIDVANAKVILIISYVGYETKKVTVSNQTTINVTLSLSNSNLNEVVVTGYSSQRKKDIAGAVTVVDVNSAKKITAGTTEQLLQGQAAGVTVINQGAPGAGSYVYIRGITNFKNSQPLYVIDGVQSGSMSDVNPNDIASIQVLKDAGAASIYGVSGGNGVVIITTKKGKQGKTVFSYDGYYGTQVPKGGNVFNKLNPSEMSKLAYAVNDVSTTKALYPDGAGTLPVYAYTSANTSGVTGANFDLSQYNYDATNPSNNFLIEKFNQSGTDWFHELFKPAPINYQNISASGANEKNSYFISLNYLDQQGTEVNTYMKRYQARINTVFSINPHIRLGENAFIYYKVMPQSDFANQNEGDPLIGSALMLPQVPVHDIAGNWGGVYGTSGSLPLGPTSNPVATQSNLDNQLFKSWNTRGDVFAEIDFLKHFTVKTLMGGNIVNSYNYGFWKIGYADSHPNNPNSVYESSQYSSSYNWTNTLLYKQTFGRHDVSFLGGYEARHFEGRGVDGSGSNLYSVDPYYADVSNATANVLSHSYPFQPNSTLSLFGKLDYIFNDKYILDATIRRDGYSAFYEGKKYGTFPSVSLAWRISEENFLKSVQWINSLKLRASYGEAGNNSNIPGSNAYSFFSSSFDNGYYAINGGNQTYQGFYNSNIGNENTTWETDKIQNFGIDAYLFDHFDLSVDIYKKSISGLLFPQPLPYLVGGGTPPYVNIGDVQNKGIDLSATYHSSTDKNFQYSIGTNITSYKNKITNLPGKYFDETDTQVNDVVREQEGEPMGSFFGYNIIGFYSKEDLVNPKVPKYVGAAEGTYKYQDINGNGKIDDNDRTFIGNPNPKFTYGINLNASYKNFDIAVILYGSQGNKDFNLNKYFTHFYQASQTAKNKDVLYSSYGMPGVTNPTLPIQTVTNPMGTTQISSFYVEDGSFLKCRVLQLGYTFNPDLLRKLNITKLHVYAQATNLFTITKYSGLDPELPSINSAGNNAFGVDLGNYPSNQRQYIFGVNFSF